MTFNIFAGRRPPEPNDGVLLILRLNARLQPIDRGEHFEDDLDHALRDVGLGEVTGGGTMMGDDGGVVSCDIEIDAADAEPSTIKSILAVIEDLGVPRGSQLLVGQGAGEGEAETTHPVGAHAGLAIFINGMDLADEVYEQYDLESVMEALDEVLDTAGTIMSFWHGLRESAIYVYGPDFDDMKKAAEEFAESCPLLDQCRYEQIA